MTLVLGGFIEIHTGHTLWELMGYIDTRQPLVLEYRDGFIILQVKKLEHSSWRTTLHGEIIPRYGVLESCFASGPLVFDIT